MGRGERGGMALRQNTPETMSVATASPPAVVTVTAGAVLSAHAHPPTGRVRADPSPASGDGHGVAHAPEDDMLDGVPADARRLTALLCSPGAPDAIDGDDTPLGTTPLERLVARDELRAWRHEGFWQPMDTLREKEPLEANWARGDAPRKVWT